MNTTKKALLIVVVAFLLLGLLMLKPYQKQRILDFFALQSSYISSLQNLDNPQSMKYVNSAPLL
ncbi:hypothetical protein C2869_03925 [Saccharobesus litoralis]|uniref:Uncharacterized protein n=1 Tax=Saccharobesus litoralis TaxID=2172099 RepID=A0A2S0VN57_9ALTE|nr:hypothetical protein [Saccharobesus litoralis]AWB65636.1 hypothetical protein C2869_03925 [Saccharobesus litoralis]